MTPRITALLPMKGHSERIPGKNFRLFRGRPLFRWILETLESIAEIERIVVNTDARDLLRSHGLEESERVTVRERKPELCGDLVSMNRILADDIAAIDSGVYLMTHATNPLLSAQTIRRALDGFDRERHDSLFSVTRFQTRFYRADGSPVNHDPGQLLRTQDLEPWFEENSCLYLFTRESFARTSSRIGERPMLFELSRTEAVDIDDEDGWRLAELLAAARAERA